MAEIDSILGTVFFFILTSVIFVVIFSIFTTYQTTTYEINLDQARQNINENKLETLLTIDEVYSKNNLINLIFSTYSSENYSTIYGKIDLNKTLKKNFDFFFGEDNYYIQIKPIINDIRLNILYDDGEYMTNLSSKGKFDESINLINKYFNNQNFKINMKVNILSETSNSLECLKYTSVECETININHFYSNTSLSEFYNYITLNDPVKEKFPNLSETKYQYRYYSINDWATFLSKVSINSYESSRSSSFAKKDVYVLFSDVLNLGSQSDSFFITGPNDLFNEDKCVEIYSNFKTLADIGFANCGKECVDTSNNNQETYNNCIYSICNPLYLKVIGLGINRSNLCLNTQNSISNGNWYYNYFCVPNTNFQLSNVPVEKAKTIIKKNNHIVYPILIHNYNIDPENSNQKNDMIAFDNYTNTINFTSTAERDSGDINTIYGKVGCEATFENQTNRIFHKETFNEHINQLKDISRISNGELITYSNSNNFYETIKNLIISTTSKYYSEIGKKKNTSDKTIISKKISKDFLGEIITLEIYLEVYNTNYQFNSTVEFVPLINNYYNDSNNFYITLSHYKPINSVFINNIKGERSLIKKIDNLLYKYTLKFNNYIPTNLNNIQLTYIDISGDSKNISIN